MAIFITLIVILFMGVPIFSEPALSSLTVEALKQSNTANIFISPLLLEQGLMQLYMGAADETAAELRKLLQLDATEEATKWQRSKNFDALPNENFYKANRLYVANEVNILNNYKEITNETVENVNFSYAHTTTIINKWASTATKAKVSKLLNETKADTKLLLLSAIYFKGLWAQPFKKNDTYAEHFFPINEIGDYYAITTPMMSLSARFAMRKIPKMNARSLEIPYANSNASMLIILPNEMLGINEIIEQLHTLKMHEVLPNGPTKLVKLYLPRFALDVQTELRPVLKQLGAKQLFTNAQLNKMTDFKGNLFLSSVFQRALIEVEEAGAATIAAKTAAASEETVNETDSGPTAFYVNRPFVFFIRDNSNILFAGRVNIPYMALNDTQVYKAN